MKDCPCTELMHEEFGKCFMGDHNDEIILFVLNKLAELQKANRLASEKLRT